MNKLSIALCSIAVCSLANAAVLNPNQALERAIADSPKFARALNEIASPELVYQTQAEGLPVTYVFNTSDGWALISADDMAEAVLGYGVEGSFDSENIPENMKYWLGEYGREIAWGRRYGASAPAYVRPERDPIAPICNVRWNQGSPYNCECPMIGNVQAITGCVATAMAQIMKCHNWPDKGEGRKSYYCNALATQINMVFEKTYFDWDNMLEAYGGSASEAQRKAVGTLMKACGYSVEMDYTTGACGAQSFNVAVALPKYFKYDNGIKYVLRDFYGIDEWEEMMYNELAEGRPIYYSGANSEAGHAFVCDGYSADGFFHINWGWGGQSNGYFRLNGLDPSSQGLGGSNAGYNSWQEVILNIKPRVEGEKTPSYKWLGAYDYYFASDKVALGEQLQISSYFYNYSIESLNGIFGLKLMPADGGDAIYLTDGTKFGNLAVRSGKNGAVTIPEDLADGSYIVTTGFTDLDGVWHDNKVALNAIQAYNMEVSDGYAKLSERPSSQLTASEISYTPIHVNSKFQVKAKLVNDTDYAFRRGVYLSLRNVDYRYIADGEMVTLDMAPGDVVDFNQITKLTLHEGWIINHNQDYFLDLMDENGERIAICGRLQVYPEVETVANIGALYMTDGKIEDVDPHNLSISCDVECTQGFFAESLYIWIFSYGKYGAEGSAVAGFPADMLVLNEGETGTAVFAGDFDAAKPKGRYQAVIWYNGGWLPGAVTFRVGSMDGIEDVISDTETNVEFFNLQGVKMTGKMQPGMYIKVCEDENGIRQAQKVIVE